MYTASNLARRIDSLYFKDEKFSVAGRTILVRDQQSGAILRRLTWSGEKFVEQR